MRPTPPSSHPFQTLFLRVGRVQRVDGCSYKWLSSVQKDME